MQMQCLSPEYSRVRSRRKSSSFVWWGIFFLRTLTLRDFRRFFFFFFVVVGKQRWSRLEKWGFTRQIDFQNMNMTCMRSLRYFNNIIIYYKIPYFRV